MSSYNVIIASQKFDLNWKKFLIDKLKKISKKTSVTPSLAHLFSSHFPQTSYIPNSRFSLCQLFRDFKCQGARLLTYVWISSFLLNLIARKLTSSTSSLSCQAFCSWNWLSWNVHGSFLIVSLAQSLFMQLFITHILTIHSLWQL